MDPLLSFGYPDSDTLFRSKPETVRYHGERSLLVLESGEEQVISIALRVSVHANLMLALAHTARCRPEGASLKGGDHLLRAAGSFDKKHTYATRLERCHGTRTDSAA